jgi:hypothetical protein
LGAFVKNDMVKGFNDFFTTTLGMGDDWGQGLSKIYFNVQQGFEKGLSKVITWFGTPATDDAAKAKGYAGKDDMMSKISSYIDDAYSPEKQAAKFKALWNAATGIGTGSGTNIVTGLGDLSDALEKEASRIESSFTDIAKTAVASFRDQQKAIDDLKNSITELDKQLQDDLDKADANYKKDVTNLAKVAQERADAIDKQIASEKASMSAGWRTRITELQAEKEKELDIVARAGADVSDLQEQMAKDDLTVLQEKHLAEVNDLKDTTAEKKKTTEDEINQRLQFIITAYQKMSTPGFFTDATSNSENFLRSIGSGSVQNVFNFNEMVAGDEGLKKLVTTVIDQLNRTATAKGFGGQ